MGARNSGVTRGAHGRDHLNSSSRRSSSIGVVDGDGLVQVGLVHRDGVIAGVHGDLCTRYGSGAGASHGALEVGLVMAILVVSHQISRGRVDLLSNDGGWGNVLVVGWDVARTCGACDCWVLKTAGGGLLVRDDGGMDQVGVCGVSAARGRGLVLVIMLVLVAENTMVGIVVVPGWENGCGIAGKTLVTAKRVLVSGTVDRVSVGDGRTNSGSAGMHRHGRRLVVIVFLLTILGVQRIDGLLTSIVGARGVGGVASVGWELVGSMKSRAGLVRVVVDVGLKGVVLPAGELIGYLGNLILDLFHGRGWDGCGGG